MSEEEVAPTAPHEQASTWTSAILADTVVPLTDTAGVSCWTGHIGETPVCLLVEAGPTDAGPTRTGETQPSRVTARAVDFADRTGCVLVSILADGGTDLGPDLGAHLRRTHRLSGSVPHIVVEIGRRTPLGRLRAAASDFSTAVSCETESDGPHFSSDADAALWVRRLVSLIPANSSRPAPTRVADSTANLSDAYADPVEVVEQISDSLPVVVGPVTAGLQVGFTSFRGHTVGFAASTTFTDAGDISDHDLTVTARVLDFCDAFHLPFLAIGDFPNSDNVTARGIGRFTRSIAESATPMAVLLTGRPNGSVARLLTDPGLMPGEVIAWKDAHVVGAADKVGPICARIIEPSDTAAELLTTLMRWSTVDEPLPARRRAVTPR